MLVIVKEWRNMTIYAMVTPGLDGQPVLLKSDGSDGLFTTQEVADQFQAAWNADVGMCESRVAEVVPLKVVDRWPAA